MIESILVLLIYDADVETPQNALFLLHNIFGFFYKLLYMKSRCLFILLSFIVLDSCVKAPDPVLPLPTEAQLSWHEMETYAFIHFGLNTYNDIEWGYGDTPASTFCPDTLCCEQWVATLKQCGMKAVILTAKHHDGFCLWPTSTTDYNISNTPYRQGRGDLVRELSEACARHGMKFGIYVSPWDRNHSDYGRVGYVESYHKQIEELTTQYGPIFEFWFDGANGGDGYYGGARETRSIEPNMYYDYPRARSVITENHPDAMIFGGTVPTIRWVGNEQGWAGDTQWCPITMGERENPIALQYGSIDGQEWLPAEVDVSIRPGWFYHKREDHQVKSVAQLVDIYYRSVGHNANLLLNFPINLEGRIPSEDSARAVEWRRVIDNDLKDNLLKGIEVTASNERGRRYKATNVNDGNSDTYWATEDDCLMAELIFDFEHRTELNRVILQEYIPLGQRVYWFSLEREINGRWLPITSFDTLTTIGYKRIVRFETVSADKLKIRFKRSKGALCISNVEAYHSPILLTEPTIRRDSAGFVSIHAIDGDAEIYYTLDASTPTHESLHYREPFLLPSKGEVRAICYDPITGRSSSVTKKCFHLTMRQFKILSPISSATPRMFDEKDHTVCYLSLDGPGIALELEEEMTVLGFNYLPTQSRDAMRHIANYRFYVDDVMVSEGEFSNILNNPIEQEVRIAPRKGRRIRFVPTRNTADSKMGGVAEFTVITE